MNGIIHVRSQRSVRSNGHQVQLRIVAWNPHPVASALEQQIREADPARRPEAGIAVTQPEALSWSPNGRYLAFVAALNAVSSDLYVYDTVKDAIQRMSVNSRQAAKPMWSPDSQFVVAQDIETFNYENGWLGTGVKAYAVMREDVRRLYGPAVESTGEIYLPWEDAQVFGVYTHTANGNKAVREVNLERRLEDTLYKGIFDQVAFDPQTRQIVFTESQNTARFSYFPLGLYMVSPGTDPISIQAGTWSSVLWDQKSQHFYARGSLGVLVMDISGQFSILSGEGTPSPSPDGMWLACWGNGPGSKATGIHLYKSFKTMLQAITTAPVEDFSWKPDSQGVVYTSGNSLYMATFPLLQPQLIGENIALGAPASFGWVDTGTGK